MANQRLYTSAEALKRDVNKYLKSIRTTAKVYETDSQGEYVRDADGNKIPVLTSKGEPMTVERYVVPPELRDISYACKGMCYDTWLKYASGEYDDEDNKFSEVCAYAKELCIRWGMRIATMGGKGSGGHAWSLKVNYGIGPDKREVELGEETRKALAVSSMTMEEKMTKIAALPAMLALISGESEDEATEAELLEAADGGEDD